jgi:hypothetical protein
MQPCSLRGPRPRPVIRGASKRATTYMRDGSDLGCWGALLRRERAVDRLRARLVAGNGRRPRWSGYEAERMPSGVGKDVAVELACSEIKYSGSGIGDIVNHDVEMELLGPLRIRPLRGPVVEGKLKRDSGGPIVGGYHDPAVTVVGNRQPQKLGVEGRKCPWIGAIDHHVMESPNHGRDATSVTQSRSDGAGPRRRHQGLWLVDHGSERKWSSRSASSCVSSLGAKNMIAPIKLSQR